MSIEEIRSTYGDVEGRADGRGAGGQGPVGNKTGKKGEIERETYSARIASKYFGSRRAHTRS